MEPLICLFTRLACVLVSRLMFNLRDPRGHSAARVMTTTTAVTSSTLTSTAVLHTLTNVGVVSEPAIYDPRDRQGGSFSDAIYCGDCEDF